jgi:hypothetical protein
MNQWEVEAYRSMPRVDDFEAMNEWWKRIAEERRHIVETYCTPKKRSSSERPNVGSPPTYDPTKEHVVEIAQPSPSRTEIKTESAAAPGRSFMYVLLHKKGRWLLDGKQFVGWDGNLVKAPL